ncbi:MAG: hypothetical protein JXR21_01485, partial [Candidatus Marinimicrobia bacterium]|nr:hypothetical protein [Candidatus Neomarinimicrobiota bacterium]
FFSGGMEHAFTRPAIDKKILFLNFRRPSRDYSLFCRLDLPLLLAAVRPAYPYVLNGSLNTAEILSRHFFAGGFRLRSKAGLTRILENGNALEFAYVWDMLSTGKRDIYLLETARHELLFTLYFRVK